MSLCTTFRVATLGSLGKENIKILSNNMHNW